MKNKKLLKILSITILVLIAIFTYIRFVYITDIFYAPYSKGGTVLNLEIKPHPAVKKIGDASFERVTIKDPLKISVFTQKLSDLKIFSCSIITKVFPIRSLLIKTYSVNSRMWGIFYTHYDKKNGQYKVIWVKESPWINAGIEPFQLTKPLSK